MKLSKREISLLFIAFIALTGLLYYNYFYKPYQTEAAQLQTSIVEQRQQLDREKLEKTQIATQAQQIEQLKADLEGELQSIPVGIDEPELLVFLEETVADLSTNHNIQFMVEVQSLGYCQINKVTMSFSSDYPNMLTILKRLEKAPYRNRILNMTVNSKVYDQQLVPVDTVGEIPDETDTDTTEDTTDETAETAEPQMEPVMVEPYLLEVYLSIEFFSFPGAIDPDKEYSFMTGPYNKPDLFPIPEPTVWYYTDGEETEE